MKAVALDDDEAQWCQNEDEIYGVIGRCATASE